MSKLDRKQLRLLVELDRNSRLTFVELARRTGMGEDTVRYRFQKLVNEGIITRLNTIVDCAKFGYLLHKIYFKLHSATDLVISRMIDFLNSIPNVSWIVRIEGPFDFAIGVQVKEVQELSSIMDEFAAQFNEYFSQRRFAINTMCNYLTLDYLIGEPRAALPGRYYTSQIVRDPIDASDRKILKMLGDNSRTTAAEIATVFGEDSEYNFQISREAIYQRIRKLEKRQIITGYNLLVSQKQLGFAHYKTLIYLNPVREEELNSFIKDCKGTPEVLFLMRSLSEWDYEFDVAARDGYAYQRILMDLISRHPKVVRDYVSLMITDVYKYNNLSML